METEIRIVVLHRGWVCVGHYRRDGVIVSVRGRVVRRWGTNEGLAQLAKEGPLEQTALDAMGEQEHHLLAEVTTFKCDARKWIPHLPEVSV